jgi:hypothetical protein
VKINSGIFEFQESGIVFFMGFSKIRVGYDEIISFEKASYLKVCLRSLDFRKRPLVCLPLGISWYSVIIEAKTKSIAVMSGSCDDLISRLKGLLRE